MPCPSIRSRPERGPRRARGLGRAALVVILLLATAAAAAESEAVRQAREHYRKGQEAYAAGRYDDAYVEFEKGYNLAPKPVFLLNLAHAERRRGNLGNARILYQKFLLIDPQSKYATEVQQVIQEIDSTVAAEAALRFPAPPAAAPAPAVLAPPASAAPPAVAVMAAPPRPARPLYRRWWVWGAAGAVVAAGLATTLLLGRASYQKEGSLGTLGAR